MIASQPSRPAKLDAGGAEEAPPAGPGNVVPLPQRRAPALSEFQSDALEIEERPPPRFARMTLYAVVLFVACAVIWAAVSPIDRVVVGTGKLVPTKTNLVVQPFETSVIRSLEVAPGDVVSAGATLAKLDPTFPQADVDQLRAKVSAYAAELDRLDAEIAGKSYEAPQNANADEIRQAVIQDQRMASYQAELRVYDQRIAGIEAALITNEQDQQALGTRLTVLREIEDIRDELLRREVGSRLNKLEAHHTRLSLEGDLQHLRSTYVERQREIEGLEAERRKFIETFREDALEKRVRLYPDLQAAREELGKAELRRNLVTLIAPADAVVLEGPLSVGSVVREADPVFTLVPLDAPLEAEVAVTTSDVGLVDVGQEVRVKIDAFPFQKHGTLTGVVRTISEDAFPPEQGKPPFYRMRVEVTDTSLKNVPPYFRLLPGMTAAAEIKVGERTVLSYFLYPLVRGLDESLREP
jgi:hemolysin D